MVFPFLCYLSFMFTGLIEDIGEIKNITNIENGKLITVFSHFDTGELKIGSSIAINGACETLVKKENNNLIFTAMNETLKKTNFNFLKTGDFVNLERAASFNSRIDGHLVSGHVDCTARVLKIKTDGIAKIFTFEANTSLIVNKGSISINGISLTVSGLSDTNFEVSILPHTFNNTNLKYIKQNESVNIEYDMVAKYIKKFTTAKKESKITKEFLIQNGF